MIVGFSSGVSRKTNKSLIETIRFVKSIGANAFEISFRQPASLSEFKLNKEMIDELKSFDYLSVHAPFVLPEGYFYGNNQFTENILLKLKELLENISFKAIVFHPTNINDFDFLSQQGLPIIIENMDIRKKSFKTRGEIMELKEKYDFGFVLDIEHSFENDPSLNLTKSLIRVMGDKLIEIHLSGAKTDNPDGLSSNHCRLGSSKYRDALLCILNELKEIPIILEVDFDEGEENLLKEEINYVIGAVK